MRYFILILSLSFTFKAWSTDYCLALRGNGELAPAHWGAVSALVEKMGLPRAQAGGSSASVTMFLIDAVASNPFVKSAPRYDQALRASLMIKSFEGFVDHLKTTDQFEDFMTLYVQAQMVRELSWIEATIKVLHDLRNPDFVNLVRQSLKSAEDLGLLASAENQPAMVALKEIVARPLSRPTPQNVKRAVFYLSELRQTIRVFGAFDAQTDQNLFFRPGLVNFDRFAEQVGRIGQFYSAQNASAQELGLWKQWFSRCAETSVSRLWSQLNENRPECGMIFKQIVTEHFRAEPENQFVLQDIGQTIRSFPSTAVLTGRAYEQAAEYLRRYDQDLNSDFGSEVKFSYPEDVRFGYWGSENSLAFLNQNMKRDDEKSRRFLPLGQASWHEALRLSPAEPGLSPLRPFQAYGQDLLSAGGWSDLAPVQILTAAGCGQVVYVTRRGGEAFFAQGIAKRLLGYDRSWGLIQSSGSGLEVAEKMNNYGDPSDMNSLWAKLYNLANPDSSFRIALRHADAVMCTNWNAFQLKGQMREMIADAYRSPFKVQSGSGLENILQPSLSEQNPPGCH